ncbi:hypothetical protein CC2G_004157 [Coprinopsis cinerea AmutBmut pab1-1]|jgi:hypothetical protein|nr:hypothetical protein CC2G_004157 [Coprinopsis cinerea AmutBmut pab1-1]
MSLTFGCPIPDCGFSTKSQSDFWKHVEEDHGEHGPPAVGDKVSVKPSLSTIFEDDALDFKPDNTKQPVHNSTQNEMMPERAMLGHGPPPVAENSGCKDSFKSTLSTVAVEDEAPNFKSKEPAPAPSTSKTRLPSTASHKAKVDKEHEDHPDDNDSAILMLEKRRADTLDTLEFHGGLLVFDAVQGPSSARAL